MTLTEKEILKKFNEWRDSINTDLGDDYEDWGPWWECFLAGYKARAAQDA